MTARTLEKGGIELCIADDGRGASEDELLRGGMHRGVDAMRERAWGVGGTMTFEETTGGGCTVRVIVPPRPGGRSARSPPAAAPARRLGVSARGAAAGAAPQARQSTTSEAREDDGADTTWLSRSGPSSCAGSTRSPSTKKRPSE